MFMSVIGAVFGQTPATLPYTCDFEAAGDNGWTLKNGTCTNQWHVGSFTSPAGHSGSLFISSDGGTTAGYNVNAYSVVVAEKLFQTGTSDSLTISFDLTIEGEDMYDYLKVYWVPADTVYDASTSLPYYADASYSTNVIMNNAISTSHRFVNLLTGTQIMSATIANEANTLKKLVFLWKNDGDMGNQLGAIIDNLSVAEPCDAPTALAVSNITETSADVSWNGTASSYQIRLNGGTPETVTTTSKTLTGLTAATSYTVEVRAVCENSQSVWKRIEIPATLPYSCDFEASGNNGWTLRNETCTNKWHVGSFTSPAGHSGSLFISSDGGTTAGYGIVNARSVVVAEKLFQTGTSDSLTISFDLTIGGENTWDYLKVYWVNADTVYTADGSSIPYYGSQDYTSNVIMNNATNASYRFVNLLAGTQRMSATIANEPNTLKKLVFVWVNDNGDGNGNGAIIDNLSVAEPCDAPTALAVSNITETSAELSWNGTATGYEVRLNGGTPETVTATSKTLTGLTAGTAYTVEVRSVCESSQSAWVSTSFTTTAVVVTPPTVNTLAASNITHDGATLNGTITAGSEAITAQGFMYKASSATDWTTVAATGTNLSATVNNLTAETAYEYKAFATTTSGTVEGEVINFTTLAAPVVVTPPTVETLTATEVTHEAATLNGTITAGSEEITAQGFMYKASSAADWTTVAATGTTITATVNNLTAETAYEYKAFATTASGTVEGAVESFTTLETPVVVTPPTVVTLAATEVTHEAATLNGTIIAGSEAITAQGFMYKASSAADWTTVAATGTNLSATVNNLTAETAYEYKAFATTASSTVEGEVINFTTLAAPVVVTPPTVETLTATEVTHEAATLNGTITAGSEAITAQGFMYKASSATDWTTVAATGTNLSATVNNLTAETAYEYKAFATTTSGTVEGEVINFTTLAAPVVVTPPTVETLTATEVTHEAATLNGTITAGSEEITAQGFMYKASSAADWTTVAATGTTLTATVNNLTAETAYEYKAFATTASSTVEGEVINFTTLAASGLADAESGAIKAIIYPNPAKDKATLSLTGLTANAKIIVSDLQGRIIQTEDLQAGTETYELNTSNYASGVYYIRILCGNNSNTQKLIIE